MLKNPFTPSEIASHPSTFFGRAHELRTLERSLKIGSVAIQGSIGIGKSSLLSQTRLKMEGFGNNNRSKSLVATGSRDITTIDHIAGKLLQDIVTTDEKQKKLAIKLPYIFEFESADVVKLYQDGRHADLLQKLLGSEYLDKLVHNDAFLIIAVDEADKCPVALARFFRYFSTHTQQKGIRNVRFIFSGVHPFYQEMVQEDAGLSRFIYATIMLNPLPPDEADELLRAKFREIVSSANASGIPLRVKKETVRQIRDLSGGHPHILQLLGSHVVENENEDPDGIIDERDLIPALSAVCYNDRANVYDATLHDLELYGMREQFDRLIESLERGFPSRVSRPKLLTILDHDEVKWFVKFNHIRPVDGSPYYQLVDEFLRIRTILDDRDSYDRDQRWLFYRPTSFVTSFDESADDVYEQEFVYNPNDLEYGFNTNYDPFSDQ